MTTVGVVDAAATRELRRAVLRPQLGPDDALPGDALTDGVHLGVTDDEGRVLSTCFVSPAPCPWIDAAPAWRLRQMATWPDHRGDGLGGRVLDEAERFVRTHGAAVLWCHAREGAVAFYARHGFAGHGALAPDEELGIPHLDMAKVLREPPGAADSSER